VSAAGERLQRRLNKQNYGGVDIRRKRSGWGSGVRFYSVNYLPLHAELRHDAFEDGNGPCKGWWLAILGDDHVECYVCHVEIFLTIAANYVEW
jgi:hypothetical protein